MVQNKHFIGLKIANHAEALHRRLRAQRFEVHAHDAEDRVSKESDDSNSNGVIGRANDPLVPHQQETTPRRGRGATCCARPRTTDGLRIKATVTRGHQHRHQLPRLRCHPLVQRRLYDLPKMRLLKVLEDS